MQVTNTPAGKRLVFKSDRVEEDPLKRLLGKDAKGEGKGRRRSGNVSAWP